MNSHGKRGCAALVALVCGLLVAPAAGLAQQPPKGRAIGFLHPGAPPPPTPANLVGLVNGLRRLGLEDQEGFTIEVRYGSNRSEVLARHAAEFVRLPAALIVTFGDSATRAAQQATTTIPIVAFVGAPVRSRFAATLARPGGNFTGFSSMVDELGEKRLELLKEIVPRLRRVAVLWDPVGAHIRQLEVAQDAARALGIEILTVQAQQQNEIEGALDAAGRGQAGALLPLVSPFIRQFQPLLAELAGRNRMPAVGFARGFVEAGGLMSYSPDDRSWLAVDGPHVIDRILKGAKPADLPFQQPTRFETVINLKTAKALGLTILPSVLVRADQVIQ